MTDHQAQQIEETEDSHSDVWMAALAEVIVKGPHAFFGMNQRRIGQQKHDRKQKGGAKEATHRRASHLVERLARERVERNRA